ncbi:MAG: Uma2 family endonuclease [Fimbriiglobus sp.]
MATDVRAAETDTDLPTSDGLPMAETELHATVMIDLMHTLRGYVAARPDVYVWGNLMVYYDPTDRRKWLAPDCFVAFGVPNHPRDLYKVWAEAGRFPTVVFEITSPSTRDEDLTKKLGIYRDVWRVEEYYLFDPRAEYLSPPLQGFRRAAEEFVPMEMSFGQLWSAALPLCFEPAGTELHVYEQGTNRRIFTPDVELARDEYARRVEAEQKALAAERKAAAAERARDAAETEIARLTAELAALRNSPPPA